MTNELQQQALRRVGQVINDKYQLERLIGVGGMASVYQARHRNGGRYALKLLHPDIANNNEARERFTREGRVANLVDHPGAVKIIDDDIVSNEGPDKGTIYLVMELLEGQSVSSRLRELGGRMEDIEALRVTQQVLEVLIAAHHRGVVHRDLKPDNLFLLKQSSAENPIVKVLDFGIARIADSRSRTVTGTMLGTPYYMSPEQARGAIREIDARSDIYSLGSTLFRMLTGSRPHEGVGAVNILLKVSTEPAPKIRTIRRDLRIEIAAIVDKSLSFRKEDRYASAKLMLDDILSVLENRPPASFFAAPIEQADARPTLVGEAPQATDSTPMVAPQSLPLNPASGRKMLLRTDVALANPLESGTQDHPRKALPESTQPEQLSEKTAPMPPSASPSWRPPGHLSSMRVMSTESTLGRYDSEQSASKKQAKHPRWIVYLLLFICVLNVAFFILYLVRR